jgi:Domain of unknown function (DUF4160)
LSNPTGWVIKLSVIYRKLGLRFIIYVDDHEPAHVHVRGDGEAKISLGNSIGGPDLVFSKGFSTGDVRRAMHVVKAQREAFMQDWNRLHG